MEHLLHLGHTNPTTLIGEQAFLLLLAVLEKDHVPARVMIPLELVIRASTTGTSAGLRTYF